VLTALKEKLDDGRVLLRETFDMTLGREFDANGVLRRSCVFTEAANADAGTLGKLEMTVAKTDIINRNGRLYSKEVFELAIGRAQALIAAGNFLGEVDHPWAGSLQGAAIRFTKLWLDGDLVKAEAVILATDHGKHLRALLDGGVGVQVSTRGYATMTTEKRTIDGVDIEIGVVGKDYTMEGIDVVLFASNPAGRVQKHESGDIPQEKSPMNLETLRKEHPDLVTAIETAAREGYVAQADVETQVAAARAEGVEAGKNEITESTKGQLTALAAVIEAVKALVPAPAAGDKNETETDDSKKVEQLESELKTLRATVEAAEAEKTRLANEAKETARVAAVQAALDESLKGYENADLITDADKAAILAAESADAAKALITSKKESIDIIAARAAAKKVGESGTGEVAPPNEGEKVELSEEDKRARRIAGIES